MEVGRLDPVAVGLPGSNGHELKTEKTFNRAHEKGSMSKIPICGHSKRITMVDLKMNTEQESERASASLQSDAEAIE